MRKFLCPICQRDNLDDEGRHECPTPFSSTVEIIQQRDAKKNQQEELIRKEMQRLQQAKFEREDNMEMDSLERMFRKIKHLSDKYTELHINVTCIENEAPTMKREKLDSDCSEIKNNLDKLNQPHKMFIEDFQNSKSIMTHKSSRKNELISNIESRLKNIEDARKIIKSKIESIEIHATNEEEEKQQKFSKDTPREVKRRDRGTGLRNSKDIHGIDWDQSGEYRGGHRSNYEGY